MHFLHRERDALENLLPGLDAALAGLSLDVTERPGNPALELFRTHSGTDLLIPPRLGGLGASPHEALHVQRALGSRSPSLALAVAMHQFAVASLLEWYALEALPELEALLRRITTDQLYLTSAFSDGRSGASILASQMQVELIACGLRISGSKKPCSLAQSMDLLTVNVLLPALPGQERTLVLALVPANATGLQRRPIRNAWGPAGAETEEVVLDRVEVPWDRIHRYSGRGVSVVGQHRSALWFELLLAGTYLGAGSALVERVLQARAGSPTERLTLAGELETVLSALESVAQDVKDGKHGIDVEVRALLVRFGVQQALERVCSLAGELLSGTTESPADVACLLASARGLAFHPPSRSGIAPALDSYLLEGRLAAE